MNDQTSSEQRNHSRVEYEASIDVESDDRFFTGFVRNISNGGVFVAGGSTPPVGTKVVVRFRIPTLADPVVAEAEVRWVRPFRPESPDLMPGMGVEFRSLPDEAVRAIDAFIQKHDTLFYDE
jgi:uncharacterized protein (TIGR02266 family)